MFSAVPSSPHVAATVEYRGIDRTQADITFTLDQSDYTPKSYLFLVDASAAGHDAREVLSTALNSATGSMARDMFSDAPGSTAQIISYGSDVKVGETLVSYEEALAASVIEEQPGTANESKALEAAKAAVDQARQDRPGQPVMVMWVTGGSFGQQTSEFESNLAALSSALGADDALMTFEIGSSPSETLSQYATVYETAEGAQQKAAWADASPHSLSVDLGYAADAAAHDHFNEVQLHVSLAEGQTLVKSIDSVSTGYKACTKTRMLNSDYNPLTASIDEDGKGFTFATDCVRGAWVTVRVSLDPGVEQAQEVFPAGVLEVDAGASPERAGFVSGLFDERLADPASISSPSVRLSRAQHTISYDIKDAQGQAPEPVTAVAGSPVAIDDASGLSKEGRAFGGWVATLSDGSTQRYNAGAVVSMPAEDVTLTPAWGQAKVELEVADVTPVTSSNDLMESAYTELGYSVLDFSQAEVDGQKVAHQVKSVTFKDADIDYTTNPEYASDEDKRRVDLVGVDDAVYARWIGESEADKVVAYLTKRADGDGYDMVVAGPGGVTAPVDARFLFSNPTQSSITEPSTWQDNLETIDFNNAFVLNPAGGSDLSYWFRACKSLKEIKGIEGLDMTRAKLLNGMFVDCDALTSIDLSSWDMSSVTMMAQLFWDCNALTSVNVSWGDSLKNVENVAFVFNKANKLSEITGVEDWYLPNCLDIRQVFFATTSLKGDIDLSHWFAGEAPAKVTTGNFLFGTSGVSSVTARGWNVPNLTEFAGAFSYDSGYDLESMGPQLKKIDLADWQTEASLDLDKFAQSQTLLESVDLANWDTGYTNVWWFLAFDGCSGLKTLNMPGWTVDDKFYFGDPETSGKVSPWLSMWGVNGDFDTFKTTVSINCDNWTFKPGAPDVGYDYPGIFGDTTYPITFPFSKDYESGNPYAIILSANNWDLGGTTQDLRSFFSNSRITMTEFSGWKGMSGVTAMSNMLWYTSESLEKFSLVDANMPNLTEAYGLFGGNKALKEADFTGWSGMSEDALNDLFQGTDQTIAQNLSLTVSEDAIGNRIKAELGKVTNPSVAFESASDAGAIAEAADQGAVAAAPEADSRAGLLEAEGQTATGSSQANAGVAAEGVADVVDGAEVMSGIGAETASLAAAPSASSVVVHPEPTNTGSIIGLRATVGYQGDVGARSGEVELSIPLPEGMVQNPDDVSVEVSGWQYTPDQDGGEAVETGFIGGGFVQNPRIETDPQTGNPVLRAAVSGMYTGTEMEIGFSVKLEDVAMQGGYKLWDVTAYETAAPGASAASNTLRFWWNADGTPPGETYRVMYSYEGELPPDAVVPSVEVVESAASVTLPVPSTSYPWYVFGGWASDGDDVVIEDGSFTMPGRDVTLTGAWSIDEQNAPRVGVSHSYLPGCAANHVPEGAPALPEDGQAIVGRPYPVAGLAEGTRASGHTFAGWEPVLTIGGQEVRGQQQSGTWLFEHEGATYRVDVASGMLDTVQFADLSAGGSSVSVAFEGRWVPDTGTISFDANGGQGEMSALESVEACSTEQLPANAFSREGHTFQGWATSPEGDVAFAADATRGEVVSAQGPAATLYAVWKADAYPVDLSGLHHVTSSNTATEALHGQPYETTLSPEAGYSMASVKVTMGGQDVTGWAYDAATGAVSIASVTGDIRIEAVATVQDGPSPVPTPTPGGDTTPNEPTPGGDEPSDGSKLAPTGDSVTALPLAMTAGALAALVVAAVAMRRSQKRR